MEQVLELKHIHYAYHTLEGETPALTDISFALNKGEFVSIVGPSGCGKSTTLRMIAGLEEITAGDLYIGDRLVNDVEPKDRDIACSPSHTTLSNIIRRYSLFSTTVKESNSFWND